MRPDSLRKTRSASTRSLFILAALGAGVFWVLYPVARDQFVAREESLVEISDIETLQAKFNDDNGRVRLVILLNPT